MMEDKNIDKLFREKLQDFQQQPPAYLLEQVLAGVAAEKRKRKIVFWRIAGVAAALLLAFVAGWQVNYLNHGNLNQSIVVSDNSARSIDSKKSVSENQTAQNNIQQSKSEKEKTTDGSGVSRFLTAEGTSDAISKISSSTSSRIAARTNRVQTTDLTTESHENAEDLLPLKSINAKIDSHVQFADRLNEKKVDHSQIMDQQLTIDQQIVEQNKAQLLAQNENRKNARWLVGAQVSPAYNVNRSNHSAQYASNMLNASSKNPVDLGAGISVEYKPGKRWSLQSGVYYAGLGESSGKSSTSGRYSDALVNSGLEYFNAPVNIVANNMMVNSTAGVIQLKGVPAGIELGTNLEDKTMTSTVVLSNTSFTQNFQYIEIPLYLRYNVIDARFDVELMGGVSSNVLVGNETFMEGSTGKTLVGKTQDMQSMNYSGTFGLGLKYGLSKNIFLNLEPRVKYYLNSLSNNAAVTYKPYTIGVFTGISYQF